MKDQEGPSTRIIPQERMQVCNGCKYNKKEQMMCGHDYVTNNYSCEHPDILSDLLNLSAFTRGRSIAFNARETPPTPNWCPFLKTNKL